MFGPADITPLFTRADGRYVFARWGRPIAPIVFGVTEGTLPVIKGAIEAVVAIAGHQVAETDPELGSNCMFFFFSDWDELPEVPDLDKLVPDLAPLVARLKLAGANQYRVFRFDESGAIKACFVFLRMDDTLGAMAAEDLALGQVVRVMLLWSDQAFAEVSPLAIAGGKTILRPEIGAVIRAGYDPIMPAVAEDPSHAIRLAARVGLAQ